MGQVRVESRMTENERHDKIMKFVRQYPKRTKAQVMRFMKDNDVSEPTTFKDITYLVGKARLLVLKDKPNSQTHYLIVNEDNEFNQIDKELSEIESIINVMRKPVQDYFKNRSEFEIDFPVPYKEAVEAMLQVLLVSTNKLIHSKDDAQMLYTKITELLLKLSMQFWNSYTGTLNPNIKKDLNTMKGGLSNPNSPKSVVIVELLSNLIEKIENFEKLFRVIQP